MVVDAFEHRDAGRAFEHGVHRRQRVAVGGRDRAAVEIEADGLFHHRRVDDVYRRVDAVEHVGEARAASE